MKRFFITLIVCFAVTAMWAQVTAPLDQLKADPRKAYGNDYPYPCVAVKLTKSPKGYKPFYISHYSRHGSRYYWTDRLYKDLDTLVTFAQSKQLCTPLGEKFCNWFTKVKQELNAGVGELTQVGWNQHQFIARTMYNSFPEVFKKGGNVFAISSLSGRCVLSMSAFCQELTQCNPKLEIREQSSRLTLDGVVPNDRNNPKRKMFKRAKPRYEDNMNNMESDSSLKEKVLQRVFSSTEGLTNPQRVAGNIIDLYKTLPSIGYEGMMDNIVTDEEIAKYWEVGNLGSYSWVFGPQYEAIPILEDIMSKADAAISGASDHVADLRFGHDTCIGPLTVLMGINGADQDPTDPAEVKNCYQNWETCKASNIQLIFYKGKKASDDILVKCLLNGKEAKLPVSTQTFPYYKWADVKQFYTQRCNSNK